MFVDDLIVKKFLRGGLEKEIKDHWLFQNIEKGKLLFESPDINKKKNVKTLLLLIKKTLLNFTPLNIDLYSVLFPEWKALIDEMNILLVVGCPKPYDAMVRENDGKPFIIFDLVRFCEYQDLGYDMELLIKQLVTHETSHFCLHKKYPSPMSGNFQDLLKFITFDEGFAHLLAFKAGVETFDFIPIINQHYKKAFLKLQEAMKEKEPQKQMELLRQSNSGPYWDKFAAISGKLFLASHKEELPNLFNNGIENFISSMGL